MNVINKVTLAQMSQNKRRTLVTIIGVIISVAMVTAVLAITGSFMDMMQRSTIQESGYWFAAYRDVDRETAQTLLDDSRTDAVSLMKNIGFAWREGAEDSYQPYWAVRAYDTAGFKNFPVSTLVEGRLPERPGEVVVSQEAVSYGESDVKVGDVLALDIGERVAPNAEEEEDRIRSLYQNLYRSENGELEEFIDVRRQEQYTVVGIVEQPFFEYAYMPAFVVMPYLELAGEEEPVTVYAALKNPGRDAFGQLRQIGEDAGVEEMAYNSGLLRYYGAIGADAVRRTLYRLAAIVMGIIVVGSVSLIYNAFAISVAERSRYLGMLSSVGATARQKRNSVFFEGFVIGLVSIPFGVLFGYLGIGATFYMINQMLSYNFFSLNVDFCLVVELNAILLTVAIAMGIIFISAYIPARRASRMAPVEAIRQTKDVRLTAKTIRTSKLTRRFFGMEGEIALKNLKRNKRRYQATVISLIISIVLFLTTGYFGGTMRQSFSMAEPELGFDMSVSLGEDVKDPEVMFQKIKGMELVTEGSLVSYFYAEIPDAYRPEGLGENEWKYLQVVVLEDGRLQEYAQSVGADMAALKDADHPAAIFINQVTWQNQEEGTYTAGTTMDARVGEEIPVVCEFYEDEEWVEEEIGQLRVAALTDEKPLGVPDTASYRIVAVVSREIFADLSEPQLERDGFYTRQEIYLNSSDPRALQKELESLPDEGSLYIWNLYEQRDQQRQVMLFLAIFVYGFITLISAVCIANIFNTISTSMALRKREFAMLRSTGMTPESFSRMIRYESLFYGIKALLYGLPLSFAVMWFIYGSYAGVFEFVFDIPWGHVAVAVLAVFAFVGTTMIYAVSKIKKENIIDSLKQESI